MNSFFEIQFVEDQKPFFQLGNLPVYKLKTTKFEYSSSEKIDTGRSEIDVAEDRLSIDQLQHQLVQEDGTGFLLETSDLVLKNYDYLVLESHVDVNLATQTRDYVLIMPRMKQTQDLVLFSTADDILDFTERTPNR